MIYICISLKNSQRITKCSILKKSREKEKEVVVIFLVGRKVLCNFKN